MATVRTRHGIDRFQIRKGVRQGCILSPCFLTYMQSTSSKIPCWMKHKLESRLLGEISITSGIDTSNDITLMAESEEELKSLLMKVKEESEKADLKLNIQETKTIASGPITSWLNRCGNNGNRERLLFWGGSKITADGDCSHEILSLVPWKKSYDQTR